MSKVKDYRVKVYANHSYRGGGNWNVTIDVMSKSEEQARGRAKRYATTGVATNEAYKTEILSVKPVDCNV